MVSCGTPLHWCVHGSVAEETQETVWKGHGQVMKDGHFTEQFGYIQKLFDKCYRNSKVETVWKVHWRVDCTLRFASGSRRPGLGCVRAGLPMALLPSRNSLRNFKIREFEDSWDSSSQKLSSLFLSFLSWSFTFSTRVSATSCSLRSPPSATWWCSVVQVSNVSPPKVGYTLPSPV